MRRTIPLTIGFAVSAMIAAGCSSGATTSPSDAAEPIETTAVFSSLGPDFTYDETAVPVGSHITVQVRVEDGATTVDLAVDGLEPDRELGAHAHVRGCGGEPSDSGPHYQDEQDPAGTAESPSDDPAYANAENELWLDFTTDGSGAARASTTVDWEVRDGDAQSIVIHERPTSTEPGKAGTAGDRLACAPVAF